MQVDVVALASFIVEPDDPDTTDDVNHAILEIGVILAGQGLAQAK